MTATDPDTETDQTVGRLNRPLNGLVSCFAGLLTFGSIAWAANLYNAVGLVLYNEQFLAGMLGLVLALAFLSVPARKHGQGKLPWYDATAALVGFVAAWYVAVDFPSLANEIACRLEQTRPRNRRPAQDPTRHSGPEDVGHR